ncbi:glucose-1-phosphate adenylyltransferase large subunit, chloroplastic/amyloplastic-like isoform X2 [Silene latifolia]|uniref:glucose-1-phosphate adenylyltransferase large subunit, chloroplastic/amyloplastic-like isoform X2 n=1 Tax=Silene latifolia TaxID=37657 RepID=UPI003D76B969
MDKNMESMVPIGGCYRLIDVPLTNCINSGIRKMIILTQFKSFSLNRHLARTYNFGDVVNLGVGFVEALERSEHQRSTDSKSKLTEVVGL